MTEQIRRSINMIPVSARGQHTRIRDTLKMICDKLDEMTEIKKSEPTKKVEVKK